MSKYTVEKLVGDLYALGVQAGDILLVHSGFRNINAASPLAVIEALEKAVGEAGTIVMPSFPGGSEFLMVQGGMVFDVRSRKTDCGVIPETFRKLPGVDVHSVPVTLWRRGDGCGMNCLPVTKNAVFPPGGDRLLKKSLPAGARYCLSERATNTIPRCIMWKIPTEPPLCAVWNFTRR